jgi:hypothetical protein
VVPRQASAIDHGVVARVAAAPADRRAYPRLRASELRGLKSARVKYGADVNIIDLSPGGVLFETTDAPMPNSIIVFEFASQTSTVVVPSRLVRCRDVSTVLRRRYEAACAFRRPLSIDHFVAKSPAGTASSAAWQRVIARFRDGRLMKAFTNDFHPSKPYLNLSTTPVVDDARFTQVAQLEALYFPRSAEDTPVPANQPHGRKIEVTLPNGDVVVGSTLNYRRDGNGFFVHPAEPQSENSRIFVTAAAVRHVRFL